VKHEIRDVKNVTISLDDELARWARVAAAKQELSLSAYLAALLRERMDRDSEYEVVAMRRSLAHAPLPLGWRKRVRSRDEIHGRPRICR
jgi:hypothetical protein